MAAIGVRARRHGRIDRLNVERFQQIAAALDVQVVRRHRLEQHVELARLGEIPGSRVGERREEQRRRMRRLELERPLPAIERAAFGFSSRYFFEARPVESPGDAPTEGVPVWGECLITCHLVWLARSGRL